MKIQLFIILWMVGILGMNAQNIIYGNITDSRTNEPISGVLVQILNSQIETKTDLQGNYEIKDIQSSEIQLIYSLFGYQQEQRNISFDKTNIEQDIILQESVLELDEVILSSPFNKLQANNVMKIEHSSIKVLKEKGAQTLISGLTSIAGVNQVSTGMSIGKPVIRGLTGNRVLVYTHGVRLENQQFGDEHGLGINESGIGSVEIIKGPASLLYGSDALGGVLYFNPERFATANITKASVEERYFSNTEGFNTSIMAKTSGEKFKFLTRVTLDTHKDYKISDGLKVTNTRYYEQDFKTNVGYANKGLSSFLHYNLNVLNLGINEEGISNQSNEREPDFPKQKVYNQILSFENKLQLKKSKIKANLGYIHNDRSEFEEDDTATLQMILQTIDYDLKYYFPKFLNVESIVGIQGLYQTNTNKALEILIPDASIFDIGMYGTLIYPLGDDVLQAGIRFDNRKINTVSHGIEFEEDYIPEIKKSFDSFSASLGYKMTPFNKTIFRLNVASGFRAPNLAELTSNGVHEGTNRYEIGNTNLANEQNIQADLSLSFNSSHFEFFANAFYNNIDNYIFLSPTGEEIDENVVFKYTQDGAELYGGEFGFHLHPHPLDWLHLDSSFETVTGIQQDGNHIPLIPANKINTTLRVNLKDLKSLSNSHFRLTMNNVFKQDKVSAFETDSKEYTLFHAGFSTEVSISQRQLDITLNVQNLLDLKYISHLSRLKPDNIPNMGRNVIFGVNFKL